MKNLLLAAILVGGCSQTGPFITHVEALPDGSLRVERCNVHYSWDGGIGRVYSGECKKEIVPPGKPEPPQPAPAP